MSSALLKADYWWPPYPAPRLWAMESFRWDEPRMNLLWLIHPEVDQVHDQFWSGDTVATMLDKEFSHEARLLCQGPPVQAAVGLWEVLPDEVLNVIGTWSLIKARAAEAQARLGRSYGSNVAVVDFKRKVMVA